MAAKITHITTLTGARFLAALMVALMHYQLAGLIHLPFPLDSFISIGGLGVSFFFILSGFILTYNYAHVFTSSVSWQAYRAFIWARFARIYPMYLVALGLMTILLVAQFILAPHLPGTAIFADPALTIKTWLANLLLIQVYSSKPAYQQTWDAPAWSISAEFFFYAIFPFFLSWVAKRFQGARLLTLATSLLVIELAVYALGFTTIYYSPSRNEAALYDLLIVRMPIFRIWQFFSGCTLGLMFLAAREKGIQIPAGARNIGLISSLSLIAASSFLPTEYSANSTNQAIFVLTMFRQFSLYTLPFLVIIASLGWGRTVLSRLLEHPAMMLLGEASYGFYILHWIPFSLLVALRAVIPISDFLAWGVLGGTIIVSVATLLYIEKPARNALRRIGGRVSEISSPLTKAEAFDK